MTRGEKMKKKNLLALVAALCISTGSVSYAADIDSMTLEELKTAYMDLEEKYNALLASIEAENTDQNSDSDFVYSAEGFTYKYLKNEVKNVDGEDYVYVFFEYTNDSGETATPYYSLAVQAFQNGIQINSYMSYGEGIPEAETAFKEIKTGTTTEIALKFELSDDSPVSLEISPMFVIGDAEIGEYEFELNK